MNKLEKKYEIDEIPLPFREIFSEYPCFNIIQSQLLNHILHSEKSLVVSAPTGSGKTVIFELAVVKLLHSLGNLQDSHNKFKVIYIAPIKSLCQERLEDWQKKFSPFGLNVISVTGDSDKIDFSYLEHHNLIISTPEKWDCLTRKWRENEKLVKEIKLFMIDEVHLLNEDHRGSTLEVIVSRMKTVEISLGRRLDEQKIRFMAVSATIPNVEDVAEWIGKSSNVEYFRFSEDVRPVRLKKLVIGYNYNIQTMTPFKFDLSLNYKLQFLMMQHAEGKPTLIFCSTRKSVEMTAKHLVQTVRIQLSPAQSQKLSDVANIITDLKTRDNIKHGIGIHHAGLDSETRHTIEDTFRKGDLPVLVTTSTLAMGVNLPAHLVIVKSTKCYDKGGFRDYSEIAMHQMIGRAGRPQFDTNATVLILTTKDDQEKFEKMIGCNEPVESNLHRHLTEHLNAEIVLRTITDLEVAMQWLTSTFLYIRAMKNPRHYGLSVVLSKIQIEQKLLEICQIDLNKLVSAGMITMDQNIIITPTNTGTIMARYYVAFESMKLFTQITGTEILMQILAIVSKCQEFSGIHLRTMDKKSLNFFNKPSNKNRIRFPLNGKIKSNDMKVNCIIQAVLGNLGISENSLMNDSFTIMRNGERLTKCLIEYLGTRRKNCYNALLNSIILGKCFQAKLWEDSPFLTKQLGGIGSVLSTNLANAGKTSFERILESNPRNIEMIVKKKPPFGDYLIEEVQHIPRYKMILEKTPGNNVSQLKLKIELLNLEDIRTSSTIDVKSMMTLLVGNNLNEIIIYERYKHSYMIEHSQIIKVFEVDACELENVEAHFISEDWVGIDCHSEIILQKPPAKPIQAKNKSKTEKKTKTSYIQMFLDMYMKIKKPLKTDENVDKHSKKITNQSTKKTSSIKEKTKNKADTAESEKQQQPDLSNTDESVEKIVERVAESNDGFRFMSENSDMTKNSPENFRFTNTFDEFVNHEGISSSSENKSVQQKKNSVTNIESKKDNCETNETNDDDNLSTKFQKTLSFEDDENETDDKNNQLSNNKFIDTDSQEKITCQNNTSEPSTEIVVSNLSTSCFDSKSDEIPEAVVEKNCCSNSSPFIEKSPVEEKISASIDFDNLIKKDPTLFLISQRYKTDTTQQSSSGSQNDSLKLPNFTNKRNITIRKNNNPSLTQFLSSRKKQKKNIFDVHPAEELEDSIFKEEESKKRIADFKKPEKKKMSHQVNEDSFPDSTVMNPIPEFRQYKKPKLFEHENVLEFNKNKADNSKKSIKWRSPLVFSPAVKFSPKIHGFSRDSDENEIHNERANDTLDTSISSKNSRRSGNLTLNIQRTPKLFSGSQQSFNSSKSQGTKFPLCDNEYKDISKSCVLEEFSEFCDPSFLVEIGNIKQMKNKNLKSKTSSAVDYYTQFLSHTSPHTEKQHYKEEPQKTEPSLNESLNENQEKIQPIVEAVPRKSDSSESLFDYRQYNMNNEDFEKNRYMSSNVVQISENEPIQHERESEVPTRPEDYSDIGYFDNYMPVNPRQEIGSDYYVKPWQTSEACFIPPPYGAHPYRHFPRNESLYVPNAMDPIEHPHPASETEYAYQLRPHNYQNVHNLNRPRYAPFHPRENYYFPLRSPSSVNHFPGDYQLRHPMNEPRHQYFPQELHDHIYRVPPTQMRTSREEIVGQECLDTRLSQREVVGSDIFNRSLQENNFSRYTDIFDENMRPRDNMQGLNESFMMRLPSNLQQSFSHSVGRSYNNSRNLDYRDINVLDNTRNFPRPYSYPPKYNITQPLYPPNDKDYVMNRFLYSLNK